MEIAPTSWCFSLMKAGLLAAICAGMAASAPGALAVSASKSKPVSRVQIADGTSLLGSYLAGHVARASRDSDSAALYYRRALAKDPNNQDILDEAFRLELAAGEFSAARDLAGRLVKREHNNSIAHIFLGLDAYKHKNFAKAGEHFKIAKRNSSSDEPTIKLALGWASVAAGHADKVIASLQAPAKSPWATHFEAVQRAFMADVAKKKAAAAEAYRAVYDKKTPNARIAEAYARHLAHWGDKAGAQRLLEEAGAQSTPPGRALIAELKAGKTPKLMVSNAEEGLAETFLGIGQVLAANNGLDAAQIYLRLALFLNPSSDIAKLELVSKSRMMRSISWPRFWT
ncbi:MAG: hypothetical protein HY765_06920 [Rhodomicrobium sp.]|nr:hypothetical protein [Rhodomicrobium sp.]